MAIPSEVILAVSLLLALVTSWALVLPFFQRIAAVDEQELSRADSLDLLQTRKEQVFQNLEELEQEFIAQKVSEATYREAKAELTAEAARCLESLESQRSTRKKG